MAELERAEDGFGLPPLTGEQGSEFGWLDQANLAVRDGKLVDYGDWEARDIAEMMARDYRARQLENVLTLPITSAERSIQPIDGDKGEAEWLRHFWDQDGLNGGCETSLDEIIDLSTTSIIYKRAYWEKVWARGKGDFDGQFVYSKLGWRPQTTCRIMRQPGNGEFAGFEQETYALGPGVTKGTNPIKIVPARAFVHIHGKRRDPLNGSSDMEVAYWCYKTKQKILFLWFQFLESVALPRIIVRGSSQSVANSIAQQVARLKGSGVLPVTADTNRGEYDITSLDVSGKGAEQFQAAIRWLDNAAADSVLAGFLNLTGGVGNSGQAGGSLALSSNATDFYLQQEESKTRELENSIRKNLFAPLVRVNKGPKAAVPRLSFEPLNSADRQTSVQLFQAILQLPPPPPGGKSQVPPEFLAELAGQVATYTGLDGKKVTKMFDKQVKEAEAAAEKAGMDAQAQQVAGVGAATDTATEVIQAFQP